VRNLTGALALLALVAGLAVWLGAPLAWSQATCEGEYDSFGTACFLGVPDAQGVTVQSAITRAGQVRAYKFRSGPGPRAAHIYLGDLWYDLDVDLYRDPPDETQIARWFITRAAETGQRVIQFQRPENIVQDLAPGTYTLFVHAGDGRAFDPARPFTVRIALGPPVCATERDPNGLYQLALTFDPREPTPSSLISFNAFVSPPYSDLFDFDWQLDGRPADDAARGTLQVAASDLPAGRGGQHRVSVTARGMREYPDPDPRFRHVPPTLSVECTFAGP
jgi:hypothetical protein